MLEESKKFLLEILDEDINKLVEDISTEFYDDLEDYDLEDEDIDFFNAETFAREKIRTFIVTKVFDAFVDEFDLS